MADADNSSTIVLEWRIKILEKDNSDLEDRVEALEKSIRDRDEQRAAEETRKLYAGIMALGGIITTLGGVIWAYRNVIFQGKG